MEPCRAKESFVKVAKDRGLKDKTIDALFKEDYESLDVLVTIEDSDLEALEITRGQRGLLKKWVHELKKSQPRVQVVAVPEIPFTSGASASGGPPQKPPRLLGSATLKPPPRQKTHFRMRSLPGSKNESGAVGAVPTAERSPGDGGDPDKIDESALSLDKSGLTVTKDNLEECLKELELNDEAEAEVRKHALEKGVDGLDLCLKEKLEKFMKCPVSIAVTGPSGAGKSSFINSLRRLHAKDKGAAKVGATETTMELTPYPFRDMEHTLLWDLPGVNTPNFPRDTYLEKMKFKNYDAVIIVTTTRFTEDDLWLAKEAHKGQKPFYFLRTKIDNDIENSCNDGVEDEQVTLTKIRDQIRQNLSAAELPNERVFLVSNILKNRSKWDFPALCHDLLENAPERNKYALVLAMVSCSKDVILMKKKELKNRIDMVVLGALVKGKQYDKVLQNEIRLYTERLGITKTDLERVNTIDFDERVTDIIYVLESILNNPLEECTTGRRIGIWFFGIGYFIGKWIDGVRTNEKRKKIKVRRDEVIREARVILMTVLDKCEELALAVLDAEKYL